MGIEPTYPAWKAGVLPLNHTCVRVLLHVLYFYTIFFMYSQAELCRTFAEITLASYGTFPELSVHQHSSSGGICFWGPKAYRTKLLTWRMVSKQAMQTWLPMVPASASGMRVSIARLELYSVAISSREWV